MGIIKLVEIKLSLIDLLITINTYLSRRMTTNYIEFYATKVCIQWTELTIFHDLFQSNVRKLAAFFDGKHRT